MTLNSVDLPHPDGPITPRNSPGATVSDRLSTAVRTPSGVANRLVMLSTTRMASVGSTRAEPWSVRFNCVAAGMFSGAGGRNSFGFPRHCRGHGGCVTRFDAHVDHGHLALLDRGDRLLEGGLELPHLGQRPES